MAYVGAASKGDEGGRDACDDARVVHLLLAHLPKRGWEKERKEKWLGLIEQNHHVGFSKTGKPN